MKALKVLVGLVVVVALVIGGSLFWLSSNVNGLVKSVVEDVGSETLKTAVTLGAVDIQLQDGRAQLSGLKVANPEGFAQDYAFQMDDIIVELDLEALLEKTISIKEVTIDGAHVVAEQKGMATNLQALQKNIDSGAGQTAEDPSPATQESGSSDVLIKVTLFQFINSSAQLVSDQWGDSDLSVPDIRLNKLGGDTGIPPEEMADAMLKPIIKQINRSLEARLKELVKGKLKDKLEGKEDELKAKLKEKLGDKGDEKIDAFKSLLNR